MKKNLVSGLLGMAIVCGIGAFSIARAGDTAASPKVSGENATKSDQSVRGTVMITKDDKGAMKECCIKAADGTMYVCSPAAQCKMLEAENGKTVEAMGVVTEKDGQKQLHINSVNSHPMP